jgi:hypothetical protein
VCLDVAPEVPAAARKAQACYEDHRLDNTEADAEYDLIDDDDNEGPGMV